MGSSPKNGKCCRPVIMLAAKLDKNTNFNLGPMEHTIFFSGVVLKEQLKSDNYLHNPTEKQYYFPS